MKKYKIFVACDTSNINFVRKIIQNTKNRKLEIIPKFGLQFFYSENGRKFLEKFKGNFFLDLKLNDISATAKAAINSIKDQDHKEEVRTIPLDIVSEIQYWQGEDVFIAEGNAKAHLNGFVLNEYLY